MCAHRTVCSLEVPDEGIHVHVRAVEALVGEEFEERYCKAVEQRRKALEEAQLELLHDSGKFSQGSI